MKYYFSTTYIFPSFSFSQDFHQDYFLKIHKDFLPKGFLQDLILNNKVVQEELLLEDHLDQIPMFYQDKLPNLLVAIFHLNSKLILKLFSKLSSNKLVFKQELPLMMNGLKPIEVNSKHI